MPHITPVRIDGRWTVPTAGVSARAFSSAPWVLPRNYISRTGKDWIAIEARCCIHHFGRAVSTSQAGVLQSSGKQLQAYKYVGHIFMYRLRECWKTDRYATDTARDSQSGRGRDGIRPHSPHSYSHASEEAHRGRTEQRAPALRKVVQRKMHHGLGLPLPRSHLSTLSPSDRRARSPPRSPLDSRRLPLQHHVLQQLVR